MEKGLSCSVEDGPKLLFQNARFCLSVKRSVLAFFTARYKYISARITELHLCHYFSTSCLLPLLQYTNLIQDNPPPHPPTLEWYSVVVC